MEPFGASPDGEWDCFRKMFAADEHDCSPNLFNHSLLQLGEDDGLNNGTQFTFCSAPEAGENESMFNSIDALTSYMHYISQESSYSSNCSGDTVFVANSSYTNYDLSDSVHIPVNNAYMSMDIGMVDEKNIGSFVPSLTDIAMEESVSLNEDVRNDRSENSDHSQVEPTVFPAEQLQLKRKLHVQEQEVPAENNIYVSLSENQKKKPRVSKDVQRFKKNARPRKNQKLAQNGNDAEETTAGSDGQSSSCYSSEEENSGGATLASESPATLNLNGKKKASRGSATDPQSLYARKRRERINERLRILQNLVPNGTKVDISTMLEEAVHYVKFLQLQIKLLSSDDLWMYAPIAHNGVDIGLNLSRKISPSQ